MKKLFIGFIPITILAAISLGVMATTFDPFKADGSIKILFFTSLAAFLWGCGATVLFILNFFSNDRTADALRRGFFFALLVLTLVIFKRYNLLYWHTGFTAIIITMLIEFWIYKKTYITIRQNDDKY